MDMINYQNLNMLQQVNFIFENNPYQVKTYRMNRGKQINRYSGGAAARIAKQRNKGLDSRKHYYRQMYLALKEREQQMYKGMARREAMSRQ